MTTPNRPPSFMDRVREAPKLVKIGVPIMLVLVIVGAATSSGDDKSKSSDKGSEGKSATAVQHKQAEPKPDDTAKPAKATQEPATSAPKPTRKPSWEERVQDALGDEIHSDLAVGDSEVLSVSRVQGLPMIVKLSTPAGGFEGPSTDDTDALASATFAKVYGDVGWPGVAMVEFFGQLVDTRTGQQSGSAVTAAYRMDPKTARQIDWSDEEALYRINWDLYRVKCLYIKGCE